MVNCFFSINMRGLKLLNALPNNILPITDAYLQNTQQYGYQKGIKPQWNQTQVR
jgi:hypothetical protein